MSWWCPSPISVLSVWIPVGTPLGPLSTLSQHEDENEILPQCEIKMKDLSLNECNYNVPSRVLETFNPPRSLCLRDPFLKPLSFRGNRAKIFKPLNFSSTRRR